MPRRAGVELVDARTRVAHRVSPEELRVGRARGDYQALCGARLLAASLTEPGCGRLSVSGMRVVSDHQVEIEAVCEVHHDGSGRLVMRREGDRVVLDARADECCVITLEGTAMTLLFDILGKWLG